MPTYCYEKENGEVVELTMTIAEMSRRQRRDGTIRLDDGTIARRSLVAESATTAKPSCWPMTSYAMACNPKQVPDRLKLLKERNIQGVTYTSDGLCTIGSAKARRELARALSVPGRQIRDMNGGYSDP